jgi:hypothetical protein
VFSGPFSAEAVVEVVRRLEGEGFHTLLAADHLLESGGCGPTLVAMACDLQSGRVGSPRRFRFAQPGRRRRNPDPVRILAKQFLISTHKLAVLRFRLPPL